MSDTTKPSTRLRPNRPPATPVDTLRLEGATVLAVWAHPDDESYLGGGLMAAATGPPVAGSST